jgi:uncharacterized protein YdaU (DUF1376 family)
MSKEETKIFHYKHYINEFIADTHIHSSLEKYCYLTLIWEAYRQKGYIGNKNLNRLMELNPDIPTETYKYMTQKYFSHDEKLGYYHQKIIDELNRNGYLKKLSSKGGNKTSLANMIKSDSNIDEYNRIWKVYKGTKLHSTRGVEQYCEAKLKDKSGLFNIDNILKSVKWLDERFQKDNINWPMMTTFFNDRDGKYWKSGDSNITSNNSQANEMSRLTAENEIYKTNKDFYKLSVAEKSKLINKYLEGNV